MNLSSLLLLILPVHPALRCDVGAKYVQSRILTEGVQMLVTITLYTCELLWQFHINTAHSS